MLSIKANVPYSTSDEQYNRLPNTEIAMSQTFWIGVYPGMTEEMIDYMVEKIRSFGC